MLNRSFLQKRGRWDEVGAHTPHSEKGGMQSGEPDWVLEGDSHAGFPQEKLTWVFYVCCHKVLSAHFRRNYRLANAEGNKQRSQKNYP